MWRNHTFRLALFPFEILVPPLSINGAERSAPPGMGSIPTKAGEIKRNAFFPIRKLSTRLSIWPEAFKAPPIIGISATLQANKSVEGVVIAVQNLLLNCSGIVKIPRIIAPTNIAIPRFHCDIKSSATIANKNPNQAINFYFNLKPNQLTLNTFNQFLINIQFVSLCARATKTLT